MTSRTNTPAPPRLFLKFFRWYCQPNLKSYIEGDLLEVHSKRVKKSGKRLADLRFIWDVLLLCRPGIIRPLVGYKHLNSYGMLANYFTVGYRNLLRNKGYSIINIGGLSIGMMVATLNGLWIWHELNFNKYFSNYDRIVQISETGLDHETGGKWISTTMTYPLGTELIEKYPQQLQNLTRTSFQNEKVLAVNDVTITSTGLYTDATFPKLFSLKMVHGTIRGLADTHTILISQSLSEILFHSEDPLNQIIRMNNQTDLTVAGVFEDLPQDTEFSNVKFLVPWSLFLIDNKFIEQRTLSDWRNHFIKIYAAIPEEQSIEAITGQIKNALQFAPEDKEMAAKREQQLYLYPMSEWHLRPVWMRQGPRQRQGQMDPILMIQLVGAIGIFVLTLACINFVNLSTARAEKRAKEVGIRKTIGTVRSQLMVQFFSESLLMVLLSFVVALALTVLALPSFNDIASKNIVMPWTNVWFWLASLGFILFTSILAGGYPALYLSSFQPVRALKGAFRAGRDASLPRNILVVFQFAVTVILFVGTVVVYQQIQFAKDRPVGYDRNGLIMLPKRTSEFIGKYETLRTELKNTGAVYEVSESMGPATEIYSGNNGWSWPNMDPKLDANFATLSVSHLHGKTVGWEIVMGRDFDIDNPSDSSGIIINESALKIMGLQDPIGEPVTWRWWSDKSRILDYKILGVVKDMVMDSPYAPTEPTIFYLKGHNGDPSWINVRIAPTVAVGDALPKIEAVFKKIAPAAPFSFIFADAEYTKKFGREERVGNIAFVFATLAIIISCLGLLGLASFVAETRTKEIGIRKVLGATVGSLWKMLSTDFIWLVLIACVIAAPLAYVLMSQWLTNFTYRMDIPVWVFVVTIAGAIGITIATVSFQAIKAALANPVRCLRNE